MKGVVVSVLEADAKATRDRFDAVPPGAALVEIRADRLRTDEIRGLVRACPRPVIVTARAPRDDLRALLRESLDAGAAYVDVERDGPLADLANGPDARRVVLSDHGAACRAETLEEIYRSMAATRAGRLKIVPRAGSVGEAGAVRALLSVARRDGRDLACFAEGPEGFGTRVLALSWGSWATFGAAARGRETGEGQPTATDLVDLYRVESIGDDTLRFALVGRPVLRSPSPAMHAAGYREAGLDAIYLPLTAGSLDEVAPLCGPSGVMGLAGLAVTVPLKREAARRSSPADETASGSGAVNTIVIGRGGWRGYNTDGPAAVALLRRHGSLEGARVALLGAGGVARSIGFSLRRAGAKVTVYNRGAERARALARELGIDASPWDDLPAARWDALVQATPLGSRGEHVVAEESLRGRTVLDVVYGPAETPLVLAAGRRGLAAVDGLDLLVEQAALQFPLMTGHPVSRETLLHAASTWLAGRA